MTNYTDYGQGYQATIERYAGAPLQILRIHKERLPVLTTETGEYTVGAHAAVDDLIDEATGHAEAMRGLVADLNKASKGLTWGR
ncbi:MAG: hypothetical protein FWC87_17285 [Acidimicrobiaceae bacterium]|nr:hypothetical protein [Acidimicrobiaceae bacterium]